MAESLVSCHLGLGIPELEWEPGVRAGVLRVRCRGFRGENRLGVHLWSYQISIVVVLALPWDMPSGWTLKICPLLGDHTSGIAGLRYEKTNSFRHFKLKEDIYAL